MPRSTYYAWLKTRTRRFEARSALEKEVREIFEESRGTYGPERIAGKLCGQGRKASRGKVKACMERNGLRSIHCSVRKRSLTDSSKSRGDGFENLTKGIEITAPFQVLSSDISYIRTNEGFEYLCIVKDVVSGAILASAMSSRMKAELVEETIKRVSKRWELPSGCIFHSDRGSQYTSNLVKELLGKVGLRQSFSRVGKPGDNAWSESFFATLKKEAVHWERFDTGETAKGAMFTYIEAFYNTKRIQERLGFQSPIEWLNNWSLAEQKSVA
jgi:putative transposase